MGVNLIVACAENRVMGRGGRLPWHVTEDLAWFHDWTREKTLILGRICYETWPRVHADGRRPIVITSRNLGELRPCPLPEGAQPPLLARTVGEALALAKGFPGELFVCGGERIFEETLPLAQTLYLTLIHEETQGDVYFPEWRHLAWRERCRRESRDERHRYTFSILEREQDSGGKGGLLLPQGPGV